MIWICIRVYQICIQVVQIRIWMVRIPFEWLEFPSEGFEFAFECYESSSNGWNLLSRGSNLQLNVSNSVRMVRICTRMFRICIRVVRICYWKVQICIVMHLIPDRWRMYGCFTLTHSKTSAALCEKYTRPFTSFSSSCKQSKWQVTRLYVYIFIMLVTLGFQSLTFASFTALLYLPWAAILWLVKIVHTFLAVMLLVSTTYSTSFPLSA